MEPKIHIQNNGQAVTIEDINAIGREAAMNAEYIWYQLLRTAPTGPGSSLTPMRGIIPSEGLVSPANPAYSENYRKSLLGGSQANDAKITVQPFVAVIGSRTNEAVAPTGAHDDGSEGTRDGLREIRLAPHWGTVGNKFQTSLQVPAAANNRWDVIYAKVDIDLTDTAEPRFIKVGDGPVTSTTVSVVKRTKVTVILASGTEATNPTKPTIPSDGGGSYYILLGYYFVPAGHTPTTSISASGIHEAFTPVLVSPGNGGSRVRPANGAFKDSGYAWAVEQWDNTRGHPSTALSANMVGCEVVWVTINAEDSSGHASAQPNGITVLDDSIDWRKRYFTTILEAAPAGGTGDGFPHAHVSASSVFHSTYSPSTALKAGQSFQSNLAQITTGDANAVGGIVVWFDDTSSPIVGAGAKMCIFVQALTGKLCVWRNNVDAGRRVLARIEASGRYANSDANGL